MTPPDPKAVDELPVAELEPGATGPAEVVEEVTAIEEVLFEEPSAEVYEHAGDIYFMTGEPEQAVVFWEKALELDPGNARILKKVKNKAYFFE